MVTQNAKCKSEDGIKKHTKKRSLVLLSICQDENTIICFMFLVGDQEGQSTFGLQTESSCLVSKSVEVQRLFEQM